jgi:long-chain acyl-CoA synthetase
MSYDLENALPQLLFNAAKKNPSRTVYQEKRNGVYQDFSYQYMIDASYALAKSLLADGLQPKEAVGIMGNNCLKWAISDYGSLTAGLVNVPIYATLTSETIEFIINNSETKILFVQNNDLLSKVLAIPKTNLNLLRIVLFEGDASVDDRVMLFDEYLNVGIEQADEAVDARLTAIKVEDLATIIYTSGTTGMPKGVMLTHENILANVHDTIACLPLHKLTEFKFLSFLPLCHVFERMGGHYLAMKLGSIIAYAESIETVAENMAETSPTMMASVPRLYEKIHAKVIHGVEQGSPLKQKIFHWAVGVGKLVANNYTRFDKKPTGMLGLKYKIATKLVFSKLQARVGGKLGFFISGGGALRADIAEFFAAAGLIILEGYGLTETSPVMTVNRIDNLKWGKVGPAIKNVEIKIAEDGEILTRGKNVMKGYYKNPEATREVIDADGWFHTGDIGVFDEDNCLKITDRKKDILVTSGGKNIAPLPIEAELSKSKFIEQVVVIGDARKFCSAIIVVAEDALREFARSQGIDGSMIDLIKDQKINGLYQTVLDSVNSHLAKYETIKKFILKTTPFSIESGELTPKLSIKRKIVHEKNKAEIEKLYEE